MTIWLVIVAHNNVTDQYNEYHIRYQGHSTVDSAKAEISEVRKRLLKDEKIPLDCYIYEAEEPLYGNTAYNLDDIDFNFYRELSSEEKARRSKIEAELEEQINV